MQHMCSTRAAVLFYSKSYQRMKEGPAQRGVSWHQRLRQEGKSQKVEASHMCCPGDEKLRCNTAVLFYFFLPSLFQRSLCRNNNIKKLTFKKKKKKNPEDFVLLFSFLFSWQTDFSKGSCTHGKHMLLTGKIARMLIKWQPGRSQWSSLQCRPQPSWGERLP